VLPFQAPLDIASGGTDFGEIAGLGTAVGILIALGLLGAVLGLAFALVAGLVWAHADLAALFGDVPLTDMLILLAGLPLVAAAGGWLFAGRQPPAIARQLIE
jgi:hypothetical protein